MAKKDKKAQAKGKRRDREQEDERGRERDAAPRNAGNGRRDPGRDGDKSDRVRYLLGELAHELFGDIGPFVMKRCESYLTDRLKQKRKGKGE